MEKWTDLASFGDRDRILANFESFSGLLDAARAHLNRGEAEMAAVLGDAALGYALARHPGVFGSAALEQLLVELGRAALPPSMSRRPSGDGAGVRHVLHVATYVRPVGGHSRLIWRWAAQDSSRRHSLALTRETQWCVPRQMRDAIEASGGDVTIVNAVPGGLLRWARRLRDLAGTADAIILHSNDDVLPTLALATVAQEVPVIFVDHADHLFWLGASTSTLVAGMRQSGLRLARRRRGIEPSRQVLLPTLIDPVVQPGGRAEARRLLGIAEDAIVLLSIARAGKYASVNGISFAEAHLPILLAHPQTVLLVVGPGQPADWAVAMARAGGRIRSHGESPDTTVFYAAADIYLDSFPHTSITSLLEAGALGIPLVTLDPHAESAEVLGADMPGLDGTMVSARSHAAYAQHLDALIGDPEYRRRLGQATRAHILACHAGAAWQSALEEVYRRALAAPRPAPPGMAPQVPSFDELDLLLPLHGQEHIDTAGVIQARLRLMPLLPRLRHLALLAGGSGPGRSLMLVALKSFIPVWLVCLARWRPPPRARHGSPAKREAILEEQRH
jgi:glycosyltransferase involved in cell wall biosynthesis